MRELPDGTVPAADPHAPRRRYVDPDVDTTYDVFDGSASRLAT